MATAIVLLVVWQAATRIWSIQPVILPAPTDVLHQLAIAWPDLLRESVYTGVESFAACALSAVLGGGVAAMLASSPLLRDILYPNLVAFQLIPKIALAPLFVIWLGIDAPSRLTFSVFISFFPVAIGTLTGLLDTNPNVIRLCRSLTATRSQIFRQVQVPYALPFFFSGLKVAATLSVIGIIIGEFISSKRGIGSYILLAGSRAETARIFAALLVLCVIGLAQYGVIAYLETRVRKAWRG
ncbi:MAG TPA: ABC transporter permease [Rhodopila sp.]|uniref:ABC transporter permease n=1 Tax=Rhodopila sp. TaxID=2480087 RepID=UPI002B5C6B69|nr:ABC transporter permease [Rhodopila sp.]HVY15815.1 ABC transporter permease [Rhodopila sp.]